jgi:mono/diheme cytochrome c family protein
MNSVRKWALWAMAAIFSFAMLTFALLFISSEIVLRREYPLHPENVSAGGPELVEEGRRLSKLFGCTSCHGQSLQGNLFNDDPNLVRNLAPNLTRVAQRYSDEQIAQAVRQGVRPTDHRALWGMPSGTLSSLSDAELGAVLAFIRSIHPSGSPTPTESPGVKARLGLVWNDWFPSEPGTARATRPSPELVQNTRRLPPADPGPDYAAGRHIAATVCSECHGSDLRGDATEGGPNLVIAASYPLEDFRHLMRTGIPLGGRDLGIMSEVAREDFVVFRDDEIDALHQYLVARAAEP